MTATGRNQATLSLFDVCERGSAADVITHNHVTQGGEPVKRENVQDDKSTTGTSQLHK